MEQMNITLPLQQHRSNNNIHWATTKEKKIVMRHHQCN